jgi:hypothetical protein
MSARYATRRRSNAIAMALSLAATLFGLGWLVLILGVLLWHGLGGLVARGLHANDAAAGRERRAAQPDHIGSLI